MYIEKLPVMDSGSDKVVYSVSRNLDYTVINIECSAELIKGFEDPHHWLEAFSEYCSSLTGAKYSPVFYGKNNNIIGIGLPSPKPEIRFFVDPEKNYLKFRIKKGADNAEAIVQNFLERILNEPTSPSINK